MEKPTLCVIFGGKSSEYQVSLRSAYNVLALIDKEKYEVVRIGITKGGEWLLFEGDDEKIPCDKWQGDGAVPVTFDLSTGQLMVFDKQIYAINVDLLFPVMHGEYAEDGRIEGLFDLARLKYVGNGAFASHICMDKALTKDVARSLGIPVARSLLIRKNSFSSPCRKYLENADNDSHISEKGEREKNRIKYMLRINSIEPVSSALGGDCGADTIDGERHECQGCSYVVGGEAVCENQIKYMLRINSLSLPLFVKPVACGSSVGACIAESCEELFRAVDRGLELCPGILVEELVKGDEVEVGVLEHGGELLVSCPGAVRHKGRFYDYDTKYGDERTEYLIPAPVDEKTEKYLRECAKKLFLQLGCRGLCRFDFFVTRDGVVFNEANTMPGFTDASMFRMLFEKSGVDEKTLVDIMLKNGLEKSFD